MLASEAGNSDRREQLEELRVYCDNKEAVDGFYRRRNISEEFTHAPQTLYANKLYKLMFREEVWDKRRIFWMWHPDNFNGYFKSDIVFQSYPKEDEIDKLVRRHGLLPMRLVYDPPDGIMIGRAKGRTVR